MMQLNCYWNRDDRYYKKDSWHGKKDLDGGTLYTQFSHFIDIMYWLFGDVDNVQAKFNDFNHASLTDFEDSGFVSFDFVNGGMGCINYSTSVWNQNLESSMTIIAENGSVKIGGQYMDKVEYCHVKDYVMPELAATNPGNDYGAYKGSAQNHNYVIENVIDVLKDRGPITTNALEGLKVVDIIERIYNTKQLINNNMFVWVFKNHILSTRMMGELHDWTFPTAPKYYLQRQSDSRYIAFSHNIKKYAYDHIYCKYI
jgi:predicted dehydrogenase